VRRTPGLALAAAAVLAGLPARAAVFSCEGEARGFFAARLEGEAVLLKLPGEPPVRLRQVPSASGAKYGEGRVVFWNKGERSTVWVDGAATYADCLPGVEHPWKNVFTLREAWIRLQLPEAWREGEYAMRAVAGEEAARIAPGAEFAVTAEMKAEPPAILARVLVYPSAAWSRLAVAPPGSVLAETESRVFALALPQSNPYPPGSEQARRFVEMARDDTYWWGAFSLLGQGERTQRRVVSGTVTYRQRIALPPGSTVEVKVADVSVADAPSALAGSARILADRQVPVPFEVGVDADAVDPRHAYAASARINGPDGRLLFVTGTGTPVLTRGAGDRVELVLAPAKRQ